MSGKASHIGDEWVSESYPFSDLLRGFRQRARVSQQTLADCLGKHRNTIRMWERGDYLPDTYADVAEIARALVLSQQDQTTLLRAYAGTDLALPGILKSLKGTEEDVPSSSYSTLAQSDPL